MSGQTLIPGANTVLQTNSISLRIDSGIAIDSAVWRLAADGKVRGDGDMIFYNQPASDDDSVHYHGEHRYHLANRKRSAASSSPALPTCRWRSTAN